MPGLDPRTQIVMAGLCAISTAADNATATATATPSTGATGAQGQLLLTGVMASYSATVSAVKVITVAWTDPNGTSKSLPLSWDFSAGPAVIPLPGVFTCRSGTVATATLAASGTGGTTGLIALSYSET